MDYTKFHIGVYLALGTAGITLIEAGKLNTSEMLPGVVLLILAGAAGGIIASSIPEHSDWNSFVGSKLKVFGIELGVYGFWSKVEHYAFWAAIILTAILVLINHKRPVAADSDR